jgi:hypothetical protein
MKDYYFLPSYDSELSFSWSDSNTQGDYVLVPVLGIQCEATPRKR